MIVEEVFEEESVKERDERKENKRKGSEMEKEVKKGKPELTEKDIERMKNPQGGGEEGIRRKTRQSRMKENKEKENPEEDREMREFVQEMVESTEKEKKKDIQKNKRNLDVEVRKMSEELDEKAHFASTIDLREEGHMKVLGKEPKEVLPGYKMFNDPDKGGLCWKKMKGKK